MFRCQMTGKLSKPGESPQKLVTKIRKKTYFRTNKKTGLQEIVGHGHEIAQEVLISQSHHAKLIAEGFLPELVKNQVEDTSTDE
jgi:hypothetical protein